MLTERSHAEICGRGTVDDTDRALAPPGRHRIGFAEERGDYFRRGEFAGDMLQGRAAGSEIPQPRIETHLAVLKLKYVRETSQVAGKRRADATDRLGVDAPWQKHLVQGRVAGRYMPKIAAHLEIPPSVIIVWPIGPATPPAAHR